MRIRLEGHANLGHMKTQFAAVTAQIDAMNMAMARSASIPMGGSVKGFQQLQAAVNESNRAFNSAIGASGAFRAEQIKINDVVAKNTELLQKQKLGMAEVFGPKSRKMMHAVYREQLAMQQAFVRQNQNLVGDGRTRLSLAIPTEVHSSWDTLNNKIGMFRYQLKSASAEMINWGKNTQWAGRQLMAGISFPVAAFGAAAGYMAYTVDKELTRISKVYDYTAKQQGDSAAYATEKEALRTAGLETGAKAAREYGAAITDTLNVQAELAATGVRGTELQAATTEVMRISTLGELEHQDAIKATIALQTVFRMSTEELTDAFNYMNSIENSTSLQTKDFAQAIPIAAAPIREFGGDIKELGILLTAMSSRGIAAAQGANALKAAMQRLGRPSAQVQEEFKAITGTDIEQLVDTSSSLTEIFQRLGEVTEGLDQPQRRDVFAGLFGSYQVTRMTALVDGMGDLETGYGQVARAAQIAQQSSEEWATTAQQELDELAESASGKFIRAWETLRAELAKTGEPFLEVAASVATFAAKLLELFNNMPGWVKKTVVFGAIFAAIVGPIVMLIGLFANFAGNIGKFIAVSLRLVSSFELLNKQQWAARAAAKLTNAGFLEQIASAEILEKQLYAVSNAVNYTAVAMSRLPGAPALPASLVTGPEMAGQYKSGAASPLNVMGRTSGYMEGMLGTDGRYRAPKGTTHNGEAIGGRIITAQLAQQLALDKARTVEAQRQDVLLSAEGQKRAASLRVTQAQVAAHRNMNSVAAGAATSTAVMAAAMGTMALNSNETVDHFAMIALYAAMIVPAVKGLGPVLAAAGARMATAAKSAAATGGAISKNVGLTKSLGRVAWGAAAGFGAMMGPVGWVTTALVAAGGLIYYWHKKNQEAIQEQIDQQKALVETTKLWADTLGVAERKTKSISIATSERRRNITDAVSEFESSEEGKALVEAFEGAETDAERATIAMQQYLKIMSDTKATAKDARDGLEIMFLAAGQGAIEAAENANRFLAEIGNPDTGDFQALWKNQVSVLLDGIEEEATATGETIADSLEKVMSQTGRRGWDDEVGRMTTAFQGGWAEVMAGFDGVTQSVVDQFNVDETNIRQFIADVKSLTEHEMSDQTFLDQWAPGTDIAEFERQFGQLNLFVDSFANHFAGAGGDADKLRKAEEAIVKQLKTALSIQNDATTLAQLRNSWEWKIATAGKNQVKTLYDQMVAQKELLVDRLALLGLEVEVSDEQKLAIANQILYIKYGKTANSLAEAEAMLLNMAGKAQSRLADETEREARARATGLGKLEFEIRNDQVKDVLKSAMEAVTQDYADAISDKFNNAMDNSLEASANYWENAIERLQASQERATEAMENRHERIMDQFENRWEARKDAVSEHYDARIENINKAIEAEQKAEEIRQRIFEAEQSRLDRLTEAANQTIDFNIALQTGDLDEAAKIRNDMEAVAQEWALADAGAGAARRSERRQERLGLRADELGERKDAVIERLENQEEARRKALEERLEMEKEHLAKVQEARLEALQAESEAQQEALRENWENRRESLDKELETLQAFIPRNMAQYRKWIGQMGGEIEKFGTGTLDPTSRKWANWFRQHFKDRIRQAGTEVASSNMWEGMSNKIAKQILNGMGFGGLGGLEQFLRTGKLPANFNKDKIVNAPPRSFQTGDQPLVGRHEGGLIDSRSGSRKGVARTAGIHPSEQLVLARKGEYMVNEGAYKSHKSIIEAINNGTFDGLQANKKQGILGGAGTSIPGLMTGIMGRMFATGIGLSLQDAILKKWSEVSMAGGFGKIRPGTYGDLTFDAEQLKNAQIIASVGREMGMSGRDIAIGIMTAITESSLRNVNYGDEAGPDSRGLFQQRSVGWGSLETRMDPAGASRSFFEALKAVENRDNMSPWMAAQAVQISAFSDGRNYRPHWNEGQAILDALRQAGEGGTDAGYIMGSGGRHNPLDSWRSSYNIHGSPPAYDLSTPVGKNVYAAGPGVVTVSKDLRGYEPRIAKQNGYRSYGRYITIRHDNGESTLYAHLSKRHVGVGKRLVGGDVIGKSGNTGYSYGPHLHFGATDGPGNWINRAGASGGGILGGSYDPEPYTTTRLQEWARGQLGKPYVWGAIGPRGYDCSGLMSAATSLAKGWGPHQRRLFYTGNMSGVLPDLGFKSGQGGPNDLTMGWRTGSPGHTSGRVGNMPFESTGDSVRSQNATPVSAFPNIMHLPMRQAPPTTPNPPNTGSDRKKDKTAKVPWTKEDGFAASAESWGPETVGVDKNAETGFWNYTAGWNTGKKPTGAELEGSVGGAIRAGTYNVGRTSNTQTIKDLQKLMPMADVLSLQEMTTRKWGIKGWLEKQGWGWHAPHQGAGLIYNKNTVDMSNPGSKLMSPLGGPAAGHRYAEYAKFNKKGGGPSWWQIAAHTIAWPYQSPARRREQGIQFASLRALWTNLHSNGVPVILGGDLNESIKRGDWIKKIGLGIGTNKGPYTHGKSYLDHLMSVGLSPGDQQVIQGLASDHNALINTFNIPSHAKGAQNIKWDNTLINAHKGEGILTEEQNSKFRWLADNIDKVATGGQTVYDVDVNISEPGASVEEVKTAVITALERAEARRPQRRR